MRRRRSPSCSSAPACTRRRPPGSRSPPISRRATSRPRVVALLYVMLLVGMVASALAFGALLAEFQPAAPDPGDPGRGASLTMVLNLRRAVEAGGAQSVAYTAPQRRAPVVPRRWRELRAPSGRVRPVPDRRRARHRGFSMQDILLEPYGGEILASPWRRPPRSPRCSPAARWWRSRSRRGASAAAPIPAGSPAIGALIGIAAFSAVIFAAPLESAWLFRVGTALIGFGGGLFAVGTLTAAMAIATSGHSGLALGAWGAVQASAAGIAIALGGVLRDGVGSARRAQGCSARRSPRRSPATASSTTSRSRCCSPP